MNTVVAFRFFSRDKIIDVKTQSSAYYLINFPNPFKPVFSQSKAQSNMDQPPIFSNLTSIYLGWLVSCLRSPSAGDQAGGAAWSFSEPIHPTPPPLLYYTTPPTSTTPPLLSTVPPFLYDILHSLVHCPPLSTISPQCSTLIPSTHCYKALTLLPHIISVSHLHLCHTISDF